MLARTSVIATALVLASASLAGAQTVNDNGTGDAEVIPLSSTVASVEPGTSEWIAINWTARNADARQFRVTAVGSDGVKVGYPAFPVDGYSSGYWDDTLSVNETDYTALKLTVDPEAQGPLSIDVTVTYVSDSGEHSEVINMPIEGSGGITEVALPACGNELALDGFSLGPHHFNFSLRNATGNDMRFEMTIPDANYSLENLTLGGQARDLNVARYENADGSYNIVLTGVINAYQTVWGQQNGFGGMTPTNDTPIIRCETA